MNYTRTLHYLYTSLPMFQRIGAPAYKADLNNTIAICKLLDNPENKFRSVHIAGTNGKGSTSHMLASVLQCAGYKVGLYTSPHLKDFRERIKINGKKIGKQSVVHFVEKHKADFEKIQPSFFEITVGMAFDYFANEKVDIAIIETGLGGRLDSTNVITPLLSVITNISYDHQALLGNTLQKIATEKAGIIKTNVPVVIGETQKSISSIFTKKAKENNAKIYFTDKKYFAQSIDDKAKPNTVQTLDIYYDKKLKYKNLQLDLVGNYQQKNICTVLQSLQLLNHQGFIISEKNIRKGVASVVKRTGLLGRWQILAQSPLTIADTGHNEAGIKQVLAQLKTVPHRKLHFVLGMVNDKDITKILQLLPKTAQYYFCKASIPRALDEKELAQKANQAKLKGKTYPTVKAALKSAQKNALKKDLIFIGGSTFTVADAL